MISDFEKVQILAHNNITMSLQSTADKIKHSKTVIFNFLQNPTTYGTAKSTGRPGILSKRSKSLIVRMVVNKKKTAK